MRMRDPVHRCDPGEEFPGTLRNTRHREFPGNAASVSRVREWARESLSGRLPAPVLDDLLLLLSELVTNAVVHSDSGRTAGGRVTVRLTLSPGAVQVEVTDDGSAAGVPAVRAPEPDDDGGRGLWLVDLLATEWGCHRDEAGGSVWFRLSDH
ncbi:anti-sigma regulatory factor, serine/threonine protein kinase [Planomonospora sphaerica]|uniref:Anti-sigma regulatory factor, serine/threonine protein kinase n=1 Tax=Planomonospora sphaerica TaxID=161355 RepID=A0A171BNB0_9ACTN|nr:ATP-binding protein [Planomonospora sphaerica]GAT65358.1 anti-sigma regulatory factor, serine/threonine protein kinase [Planomonospora sphaerica]